MLYFFPGAAPVIDGKVYLVARAEITGTDLVLGTKVDIYDPATNTWEQGSPLPLPLTSHVILAVGGKIYALGGCNSSLEWGHANRSKREVISYDTEYCSP